MTLNIPDGFRPTYEQLMEVVDWVAGDDFIVRPNGANPFTVEQRLENVKHSLKVCRQMARNALEGRPLRDRRGDEN